jgi:opacity protein-like surface antigen
VQAQPTTYVEAAPLGLSRADEIRKARQGAEIQTESKIVEKLEESRLEDERRRADRLFGNRWESVKEEEAPVAAPVVEAAPVQAAPAPVIQVVPVQVEAQDDSASDEKIDSAKSEIINEIRASQTIKEEAKSELKNSTYVGALLGMSEYNADNMQGNGAAGFSVGTVMSNGLIVEGSFVYSNYYIDEYWKVDYFKELDQYNFNLSVKYSPLMGMFRPFAGVTAGYTHRLYTDRTPDTYGAGVPDDEEITTGAVDAGLLLGVDLAVTQSFTIGAEYRYSRNIVNRSDSAFLDRADLKADPADTTPIEELDYSLISVSGKFTF